MSLSSYHKIGVIIKSKRESFGISADEFATILGYKNAQIIWSIESGSYRVPGEVLGFICSFLQIPELEVLDILSKEYRDKIEKDFYNGTRQYQNLIEKRSG